MSEPSQAFLSGHTTKAYNRGLGLATLPPELGTELVTRSSEAGNNRVVIGVHYPLDVIGGRISASADVAALWSDVNHRQNVLLLAHDELENCIASKVQGRQFGRHRRRVRREYRRQRQERLQELLHGLGVAQAECTAEQQAVRQRHRLRRGHGQRQAVEDRC